VHWVTAKWEAVKRGAGEVSSHELQIEFACLQPVPELDLAALKQDLLRLFVAEGIHRGEISVAFVSDPEIHRLNRQYLDHDYATDVLSFALEHDGDRIVGEVIVSVDMARTRCQEFGWTARHELTLYVIHGALHLVGYRDKSVADQQRMRGRESHYLALAGLPAPTDAAGARRSNSHLSGQQS
jgi:probable rRNA maturation factor